MGRRGRPQAKLAAMRAMGKTRPPLEVRAVPQKAIEDVRALGTMDRGAGRGARPRLHAPQRLRPVVLESIHREEAGRFRSSAARSARPDAWVQGRGPMALPRRRPSLPIKYTVGVAWSW